MIKINNLIAVLSITAFTCTFFSCSKEEALYKDNYGNEINKDSPVHPITGKKSFQCNRYFSTGNFWESYDFETAIIPTHTKTHFVIGSMNINGSGQRIEKNSSFIMDEGGNLSSNVLVSNYGNNFSLSGQFNFTTKKIKITLSNLEGGYCICNEK